MQRWWTFAHIPTFGSLTTMICSFPMTKNWISSASTGHDHRPVSRVKPDPRTIYDHEQTPAAIPTPMAEVGVSRVKPLRTDRMPGPPWGDLGSAQRGAAGRNTSPRELRLMRNQFGATLSPLKWRYRSKDPPPKPWKVVSDPLVGFQHNVRAKCGRVAFCGVRPTN